MALIPTVTVAIFAVLTVNLGLEGWFSDRVRQVVGSSLSAAEAYEGEHRDNLMRNAQSLARVIDFEHSLTPFMRDPDLREVLTLGQQRFQPDMREAYVIDGVGELKARGERSYLFNFEKPSFSDLLYLQW